MWLDEHDLAALCERTRPRLLAFLRQRGVAADADDVVQETLLAATEKFRADGFVGVDSLEDWIYGVLKHKLLDHRRSLGRAGSRLVAIGEGKDDEAPAETRLVSGEPNAEFLVLVAQAMESLPPRHWLILMLNQQQGLKTREIAPVVGLSPGRTGAILAEAKEMVRRALSGEEKRCPRRLE